MSDQAAVQAIDAPASLLFDDVLFVRAARMFALSCGLSFVVAVTVSALAPTVGASFIAAISGFQQTAMGWLDQLFPSPFVVILVGNLKGAVTASVVGIMAAFALGHVYRWEDRAPQQPRYGWAGALSYVVASGAVAIGRRLLPGVSRPADVRVRIALAVAALAPAGVVAVNGLLLGAHFAAALVHGWAEGLALAIVGIFPHGVFELPALFLAGATGLDLARRLASPAAPKADQVAQVAVQLLSSGALARTALLLAALLIAGAGLETLFLT